MTAAVLLVPNSACMFCSRHVRANVGSVVVAKQGTSASCAALAEERIPMPPKYIKAIPAMKDKMNAMKRLLSIGYFAGGFFFKQYNSFAKVGKKYRPVFSLYATRFVMRSVTVNCERTLPDSGSSSVSLPVFAPM